MSIAERGIKLEEQMTIKIDNIGDCYNASSLILYGKMKDIMKGFKHEDGYALTSYSPKDGSFKLDCARLTRKEMHDLLLALANELWKEETDEAKKEDKK